MPSTGQNIDENQVGIDKQQDPIIVDQNKLTFRNYQKNLDTPEHLMKMIESELSEPYSIFLYRYFLENFPDLTILTMYENEIIGVIIGKIETHGERQRGYIAMLTVLKKYRRNNIGGQLVQKFCKAVEEKGGDEVCLETECVNIAALKLYESIFVEILFKKNQKPGL